MSTTPDTAYTPNHEPVKVSDLVLPHFCDSCGKPATFMRYGGILRLCDSCEAVKKSNVVWRRRALTDAPPQGGKEGKGE